MLRPIVQRFVDPSVHNTVGTGLDKILQNAQALPNSFSNQPDFIFTISNPKRTVNEPLNLNLDIMEPTGKCDDDGREVGIMLFPGLFKIKGRKRVCIYKMKVVTGRPAEREEVRTGEREDSRAVGRTGGRPGRQQDGWPDGRTGE